MHPVHFFPPCFPKIHICIRTIIIYTRLWISRQCKCKQQSPPKHWNPNTSLQVSNLIINVVCITNEKKSHGNSVSIETMLWAGPPGFDSQQGNNGIFCLLHRVQTGSGALPMGTGSSFPESKANGE
jgi:hypothetical protein